MTDATPGSARVTLSFCAKDIPRLDLLSKSDPFLVLYSIDATTKLRKLIGYTETIMNNEDPDFQTRFQVEYCFSVEQRFRLEMYDLDEGDQTDLSRHDFIGYVEFLLSDVMSGYQSTAQIQLKDKAGDYVFKTSHHKKPTWVKIKGDQQVVSRYKFSFKLSGIGFPTKSGFLGLKKETTRIEFCRMREHDANDLLAVYTSNQIKDNANPSFSAGRCDVGNLTLKQDLSGSFMIRALKVKDHGEVEVLASNIVDMRDLLVPVSANGAPVPKVGEVMATCDGKIIDLMDAKGKKSCQVRFDTGSVKQEFNFLDFLAGGVDFNFFVAIDMSAANGSPQDRHGLHYLHPGGPNGTPTNQYITALRAVGSIVANYCQKQFFPIVGFSANVSIDNGPQGLSHCFPLSLNTQQPYATGIEDCVKMYTEAVQKVTPGSPTCFEKAIAAAASTTLRPFTPEYQHWNIMLILTAGVIDDMQATIDKIVESSDKPLSIIIVGLGQNDFAQCERLDGDEEPLVSSTGQPTKSDIVQFCPFIDMKDNAAQLSKTVLEEIPAQLENFMQGYGIAPIVRQQQHAAAPTTQ